MAEIFLSHSGYQKPFVERLKDALQAAGHSPFFDVISLPKAEPFPPNIEEALQKCKLGVVVLSEEFMMSHWPMRELALLHHNPCAKILPLFYNLSPHDLKSEENLSRWRPKWSELREKHGVDTSHWEKVVRSLHGDVFLSSSNEDEEELGMKHGMDTSQWEKVVRSLPSLNGEVFLSGSNEASYINKVVKEICKLVPLSPHYDVLGINGKTRLCEVIRSRFQAAQSACKSISCACTIALHGVGGAGKTTICKLMANAYSFDYPGKSLWLEFPYDGNKTSIAEQCKKLLRLCTNASDEHVLSKATSLDEIFPELDKRMSEHAVFLAIDNIWESTSEEARRLLQVKFNKESKILITSRSRAVLKELLKGCDVATCMGAVPSMKWEEALSTFEMWVDHDLSYVPHKLIDRALKLCLFEDSYHPLALKALGKRLGRMQGDQIDFKEMEANISRLSLSLVDANIEKLIRINYDNIPLIRQHMFLDVVVVFLSDAFQIRRHRYFLGGYDAIQKGLRILYAGEQHSKYDVDVLMHQLAWDGLLDFEGTGVNRRIVVHDLYMELAKREAIASPRFFLGGSWEINSRDWSVVKRVVLPSRGIEENMVKVIEQDCPQLEVLIAMGSIFQRTNMGELQLAERMGALRILILQYMSLDISTSMHRGGGSKRLRSAENACGTSGGMHVDGWRGCVGRLAWLELVWCTWGDAVEAVYDMDKLEVLILHYCQGPWNNWSKLCHGCGALEEFIVRKNRPFDDSINNSLSSLSNLKKLRLSWVMNLNILAVSTNLQILEVESCSDLQEICSLGPLHDLNTLSVEGCGLLKAITGLNGATQLQKLSVSHCDALEEIPGLHDLVNLKHLSIEHCPLVKLIAECSSAHGQLQIFEVRKCASLEKIQGLHGFFNLESLSISECPLLDSISDHSISIRELSINHCPFLKVIPRLNGVVKFEISRVESLEEIQGLHDLMKILMIGNCPLLKAIPPLSGAVQLTQIDILECESLEEIPAFNGLISLEWLHISHCPCLKAILLDLRDAVQLETIRFESCESLKEIPGSLHGLINLSVFCLKDCPRLIAIPDSSGAVYWSLWKPAAPE